MSRVDRRVVEDAARLSEMGADLVADLLVRRPAAAVVVATGWTPMGLYDELAARRRTGRLDASRTTVLQLDEYLGLAERDRRSLFAWMGRSFLEPLQIAEDRVIRLPLDGDLDGACAAFDDMVRARGGIDLAILGLGRNGHLGFNEPPSDRGAPTRVVELTPETIAANAAYWGDVADVPTRAVTMGMATLLSARAILVLVTGAGKRAIVHEAFEGPITPSVPASFLQTAEADVTVIVDSAAWGGA
jgi:glucosamine-6-phosphate deaminase